MREFRKLVLWMHLILGLTSAMILGISGGAASVIHLVEMVQERLAAAPPLGRSGALPAVASIVRAVEEVRGVGQVAAVDASGNGAILVTLRDETVLFVNPETLEIAGTRPRSARVAQQVRAVFMSLHADLMLGSIGWKVVLISLVEFMLLAVSGFWLWWRKKHWRFAVRGSLFRVSWDLHSAAGIWSLVPVAIMAATALLLAFPAEWPSLIGRPATEFVYPPAMSVPDDYARLTPIDLGRALALADSAGAGAVLTVTIPRVGAAAYQVGTPDASLWINQYSGEVVVRPITPPTPGDELLQLVERIHTGDQFGLAGVLVMSIGSFMLALMSATGLVLGWKRLVITFGGSRQGARDPA